MKLAIHAWLRSLAVIGRSPLPVLALAAVAALWGWAGYAWLGLPESSVLMLIVALLWGLALVAVVIGFIVACLNGVSETVTARAHSFGFACLLRFRLKQFGQTLLLAIIAAGVAFAFGTAFAWINRHALEVASFLTFHSGKPVSHILLEKIFAVIEGLLWIGMAGFFLKLLLQGLRDGWTRTRQRIPGTLSACFFKTPFLTGVLGIVAFGGIPHLLATWHPKVTPGFPDYTQMIARLGAALVLLVVGWLFWILSLAQIPTSRERSHPEQ